LAPEIPGANSFKRKARSHNPFIWNILDATRLL
jgi:hypothetical protein